MTRGRKPKNQEISLIQRWKSGDYNPLKPGTVCKVAKSQTTDRFIIGSQAYEVGMYFAKSWHGPKPWDYNDITIDYKRLEVVSEDDPTVYTASDKYPGPASDMIRRLNAKMEEKRLRERDELSSEERERRISILEEELSKPRIINDETISVVDDDDDDDGSIDIRDPLEMKRSEILEED